MDGIANETSLLAYVDCNGMTVELGRRMLKIVRDTPVIGGIGAADPYRDLGRFIDQLLDQGFSGFINAPSIGEYDSLFRSESDGSQIGYPQEIELIETCSKKGVFSVAFAFDEADAKAMGAAGADVVCAHIGPSGLDTTPLTQACDRVGAMREAARRENPAVIVICHGGPLVTPENVQECILTSGAQGFLGSSILEKIPVEIGVSGIVKEFSRLRPR